MSSSIKIKHLTQILYALEEFKRRKQCLLNINKLAEVMNLSMNEVQKAIDLLLQFQQLLVKDLNGYTFCKKWKNNHIFLWLESKKDTRMNFIELTSKEIQLNTDHSKLLSDITYYFTHVNIGKGFDLQHQGTELSKKVRQLEHVHPYLFEHRGNGLIYPTNIAVSIGTMIRSYTKSNRVLSQLQVEDYIINIK